MFDKLKNIAGKATKALSSTTNSVGDFLNREDTRSAIESAKKTAVSMGAEVVQFGKEAVQSDLAKDVAAGAAVGAVIAVPLPIIGPAVGATVGAGLGLFKNLTKSEQPSQIVESQKRQVDIYAEMLKLEDLRQKGILTEEEFVSMKKRLLSDN